MISYLLQILLTWILLLSPHVARAQGYSIEGSRIVVEGEEQWEQWTYPNGTLIFENDGSFHPVYIRKNINACLNAGDFTYANGIQGGVSDVRSNPGNADNVIDGDLTTYWEPDREDPLRDWWMEIDLGRLVSALKVVIRFAEDGDPFLGFKVQTWSKGLTQVGEPDWVTIARVTDSDITQHVFEFELEPHKDSIGVSGKIQKELKGDAVQYIRIIAVGRREDKAEEIGKEEYEALDPTLRGAVEHFRITPTGEERLIDKEGYEKLDPSHRGSIRYYRREVPRIAEVEVRTVGDNVALGTMERGGFSDVPVIVDGDFGTSSKLPRIEEGRMTSVEVDLGATFWIDAARLVLNPSGLVNGYRIGLREEDGITVWKTLPSKWIPGGWQSPNYGLIRTEDRFPGEKARVVNVQFNLTAPEGTIRRSSPPILRELQLYGEGYIPDIEMVSPIIEVGEHKSLTSIRWDADTPAHTKVEIRTRTGNTLKEEVHYFDKGGREVPSHEYHDLPFFRRGEKVTELVPGDDWSVWSEPYSQPGARISSPTPRKYLQIQAVLLSDDPETYPTLRSLQIQFFTPLAQQIVGEIYPTRAQRAGKSQDFSLYLRPSFVSSNMGFDEILLHSPSRVDINLQSLHIGTEEEYAEGSEDAFSRNELDIRSTVSDSLLIHLPYPIVPGEKDLIQIRFSAIIYLNGSAFEASVIHSSSRNTPQRVDVGNATGLVRSEEMRVFVPVERRVIGDVEIWPEPFTPNGDGVNDEVRIAFSVFKVYVSVPVVVEIWDLSGRRVRRMEHQREKSSGRYSIGWDGRDEEERAIQPGVYMVRIGVENVSGEEAEDMVVMRTVSVVY